MDCISASRLQRAGGGAPRTGWVKGDYDGDTLDLTFQRQVQTIDGEASHNSVSVETNGDGTHVSGSDGAPVDLRETWKPTDVSLDGSARDGAVDVHFDWGQKHGGGTMGGQNFRVDWTDDGQVTGSAFGGPIRMEYDPISGNIQGTFAGKPIKATITNLDLTQFLENTYLLAP